MPLPFGIAREIGPFPSQNKPPLLVQPQDQAFWSAWPCLATGLGTFPSFDSIPLSWSVLHVVGAIGLQSNGNQVEFRG